MTTDWTRTTARKLYEAHVAARHPIGYSGPPNWDQLMASTQAQWCAVADKAAELVTEFLTEAA